MYGACVTGETSNPAGTEGDNEQSAQEIEELIVTGTFIQSSADSAATPLTQLSSEQLGRFGATDFKDIVQNLSFNAGSLGTSASNWVGDDSSTGNASINVRNLGNGATLVLLNGKRFIQSEFNQNGGSYADVQTILPNIAIRRIDFLKDGASAFYGSDAVAGVANIVARDGFEGVELESNLSVDHESGQQRDLSIQGLFGRRFGDAVLTFSTSYLDRGELTYSDRFDRFGRSGLSSFGQPGRYIPQVDADGPRQVSSNYWWPSGGPDDTAFSGSLPDMECERASNDDGPMGSLGLHPQFSHICVYDYSTFFALIRPQEQLQTRSSLRWELGDNATLYSWFSNFRSNTSGGNSFYPDVRYVILPAHNLGLQLDAARRGFQPVPYQALQRVLGGASTSDYEERPVDTRDTSDRTGWNFVAGLDSFYEWLGLQWDSDLSISISNRKLAFRRPTDTINERIDLAIDGFGGPNCNPATDTRGSGNLGTGNCFYYNSFQTSVYDPVTGERWLESSQPWAADPSLTVSEAARQYKNPPELFQWVQGTYLTERSIRHLVVDWVANSTVGEFRGNDVDMAVGTQFQRESTKVNYDEVANVFGYSFLSGDQDWTNRISTWSVFSEVRMPIADHLELNAALRNTRTSHRNASSLDPKLALLADVSDDLAFRISWGTSFKVGSLLQTGGSRTIFRNSSDPFSNAVSLAYRSSQARGNPDLSPESADTLSAGFTWNPQKLRGFELNLDWYRYEYSDLIFREGHQALIDLDNQLRCPDGINGDPNDGPLCGVWDHDGDGVETVFSIGGGIPAKVIRRADGYLVRTEPRYLNAHSLTASGIDLELEYQIDYFEFAPGLFVTSFSLSHYLEYSLLLNDGQTLNGLGRRNATNFISRPMPRTRGRFEISWLGENQSRTLSVQSISGYRDESTQTAFLGAYLGYAPSIDSMTTVDVQYQYKLPKIGKHLSNLRLTVGIKNVLNEDPPLVIVDGAYDYYTHDPRGRIYYVRLGWEKGGE